MVLWCFGVLMVLWCFGVGLWGYGVAGAGVVAVGGEMRGGIGNLVHGVRGAGVVAVERDMMGATSVTQWRCTLHPLPRRS